MSRPFIIWAPNIYMTRSNGTRALYLLSKELTKKGYTAYMYTPLPHSDEYNYIKHLNEDDRNNAIVIYPEIVSGNPLRARNIVRYILNFPGLLAGEKIFHSGEIIFTWSNKYFPNVPTLTVPCIDTTFFYNDNSPKTQDCIFVHKNGKFRSIPELNGLTEINMGWPKRREDLGKLLRSTGTLYSYDNHSAIIDEAQICGAKVKIITENSIIDAPSTNDMHYDISHFEAELNEFIRLTQNMHYKGTLQAPIYYNRFIYGTISLIKMIAQLAQGHFDKASAHMYRFLSMVRHGNYDIFF